MRYSLLLSFCVLQSCATNSEPNESAARHSDAVVYIPPSELAANSVVMPPEAGYNKQREAWEEENPVPGEDFYSLTGWSWLRSYAQQASVALMHVDQVECAACSDPSDADLVAFANASTMREGGLRADQPFLDQTKPSYCSGTLVDDNLILTAGHCIREKGQGLTDYNPYLIDESDKCATNPDGTGSEARLKGKIENLRVVFNYFNVGPGERPHVSRSKDVFRAREVVWTSTSAGDFGVLQLVDASGNPIPTVRPRFQPAPLRNTTTANAGALLTLGQPLAKIGTPWGVPLKIAASKEEGVVSSPDPAHFADGFTYFNHLDIWGGDSGGGIYELDTFSLVGPVSNGQALQVNLICPTVNPPQICVDNCGTPYTAAAMAKHQSEAFPTKDGQRLLYDKFVDSDEDKKAAIAAYEAMGLAVGTRTTPSGGTVPDIGLAYNGSDLDAQAAYTIDLFRLMFCGEAYYNARKPPDSSLSSLTIAELADFRVGTRVCKTGFCEQVPGVANPTVMWPVIKNTELCNDKVVDQSVYKNLPAVDVSPGREITLSGNTTGKGKLRNVWLDSGNTTTRCNDQPGVGGDVAYRISATQKTILYADTFGKDPSVGLAATNFDTIIALYQVAGAGTSSETWTYQGCWDDTTCGDTWTFQSQGMFFLDPGEYVLLVTGWGGWSGPFRLHLQTVPGLSKGEVLELPQTGNGWYQGSGIARSTFPIFANQVSDIDAPNCQSKETARAREYEFVAMSCPMPTQDVMVASTISPETDFDTVLSLRQGNQAALGGGVCNDDHGIALLTLAAPWANKRQSLLGLGGLASSIFSGNAKKKYPVVVSSGAGVRVLVVDGYFGSSEGNFGLYLGAPTAMATTIEAE